MVLQQLIKLLIPILILIVVSVVLAGTITLLMIIMDSIKRGRNH